MEPVTQKKGKPQLSTFCYTGEGMNMIKSESQNAASQQGKTDGLDS